MRLLTRNMSQQSATMTRMGVKRLSKGVAEGGVEVAGMVWFMRLQYGGRRWSWNYKMQEGLEDSIDFGFADYRTQLQREVCCSDTLNAVSDSTPVAWG